MRGNNHRRATVFLSVGLSALLVLMFVALGGSGRDAQAASNFDKDSSETHSVGKANGNDNFGNNPSKQQNGDNGNGNGTATGGGHTGGNINNNKTDTATTVLGGHTVTTRRQSGQPTRVCVEHVVNGKTNVQNYDPFNPGNANQIVQELIASSDSNPVRVRGNETWQLCAAAAGTTTTTTTTAGTTVTTEGTTTVETTTTAGTTTEATAEVVTTAVVAGTTTTVEEAVVTPEIVEVAPEAPSVATATVLGVSLPRAGGLPILPGALAGLGVLLSLAGAMLRRHMR